MFIRLATGYEQPSLVNMAFSLGTIRSWFPHNNNNAHLIFSFQIIPIDDLGQFKGKVILCDLLNSAMCVFFIFILSVQLTEERQYKKHLVNVCGKPGLVVMWGDRLSWDREFKSRSHTILNGYFYCLKRTNINKTRHGSDN